MGEGGIKTMDDFGRFSGFQGTNSERTLGVLFQHLTLALGGPDCRRRILGTGEDRVLFPIHPYIVVL